MKKLAARDFEDLLQCSIPVFEGLLPEPHNGIVLDLLFVLCTWHAYAKLRLHTASTLDALKKTTKTLGQQLRYWVKQTCSCFNTRELPKEETARHRRKAAAAAKLSGTTRGRSSGTRGGDRGGRARMTRGGKGHKKTNSRTAGAPETLEAHNNKLRRFFNMCTYKIHALGHYVAAISRFGTTDGYSTQIGELEHRRVKRFYARTNKRITFTQQIAKQERRQRLLRRIMEQLNRKNINTQPTVISPDFKHIRSPAPSVPFEESDSLPKTSPELRYHISNTTHLKDNLFHWVDFHDQNGDEAVKDFISNLKDHILSRLLGHAYDGDEAEYSEDDHDTIQFVGHSLYRHKTLRVNYTTYDLRRQQDSINPRTHPDIMLLSHEEMSDTTDAHPYWYARVIGIFHVDVLHSGPHSKSPYKQRIDFLWVRWFGRDMTFNAGWRARRLHRVGFLDAKEPGAFGFLNPASVIRSAHLIPAFAHGQTNELLSPSVSVARMPLNETTDWQYHYINMFVDRDMFMRFHGGGVGHKATNTFKSTLYQDAPENNLAASTNDTIEGVVIDNEDAQLAEEEDYGYSIEDDEDEGDGEEVDDMGAEDGEEPWDMNDLEAEGYDEL